MNIFYLDHNYKVCAQMHNDKHCIKMILEYCQLLSTAHRVLDGVDTVEKRAVLGSFPIRWRNVKKWKLSDDRDNILYAATHINHPSAIWCRNSKANYDWLYSLLVELCNEYTYRYGKVHKCEQIGLVKKLSEYPKNIKIGLFTQPTPAMPEEYVIKNDSVKSYRNYYINSKQHIAQWSGKINSREVPKWYSQGILELLTEQAQNLNMGY